jgi:hypothetical protein
VALPEPVARAQGAPPAPVIEFGRLTVTGTELREARFTPPFRTWSDGKETLHRGGWHVVLHGGPFPVRALDPILWLGDTPIRNYQREVHGESEALLFCVTDPALLRSERTMTLIYGEDERTRTQLLERLDPESLVRLPDGERRDLALPELEHFTLRTVRADGRIGGSGALAAGRVLLAARFEDGRLQALLVPQALDRDGRLAVELGALPERATRVVALLVGSEAFVLPADLRLTGLPKDVELLDSKPIARR